MNAQVKMLLDQIDGHRQAHENWVLSPSKYPEADYWEAMEVMLQAWANSELPPGMRDISAAMDRVNEEWQKFENRDDQGNPYPHQGFWRALENLWRLREAFNPPKPLDPIPSVAELAKAGVSKLQIAMMWPIQYDDIDKEIELPGSIIKPGTLSTRDQQLADERAEFEAKLEANASRIATSSRKKRSARVLKTIAGDASAVSADLLETEAGPDDDFDGDDEDAEDELGPLDSVPLSDVELELGDEERVALMHQRGYDVKQISEYLDIAAKVVSRMVKRQSTERTEAKKKAKRQPKQTA